MGRVVRTPCPISERVIQRRTTLSGVTPMYAFGAKASEPSLAIDGGSSKPRARPAPANVLVLRKDRRVALMSCSPCWRRDGLLFASADRCRSDRHGRRDPRQYRRRWDWVFGVSAPPLA